MVYVYNYGVVYVSYMYCMCFTITYVIIINEFVMCNQPLPLNNVAIPRVASYL